VHINLSKKNITWKIYSQTAIVDLPIKTSNHLFSLNKSSKEKTVTVGSILKQTKRKHQLTIKTCIK
jgi:hypothetical protein